MLDSATVKKVLQRIPYGLYVVGSLHERIPATMVANWVTQVSFDPPWVAIAVEEDSKMRGYIERSGVFCVNILPAGGIKTAKAFLKSPEAQEGTIGGRAFEPGASGTPFLLDATASFECKVMNALPVPDHVLFIGEVIDAVLRKEGSGALTLRETGWRYSR
ncbi:MAG TPA: flavin reductase family protein [Bacteroidota bacterium]|nr:flavin reductase family protein [Bacteroidota bacterium]